MLVKITKLTFYPFRPNPDLVFYYATTDTLTFRGIATPELAEALVTFFENGESFECKIEERQDGSMKLTQLLSEPKMSSFNTFGSLDKLFVGHNKNNFTDAVHYPKQITLFKWKDQMKAVLKHKTAAGNEVSYFGRINTNWVLWFLLNLRQGREVILSIDRASNFHAIHGDFNRDEYYKRSESTYIDNPRNFFCANESSSLRRPDYKKEVETKNE